MRKAGGKSEIKEVHTPGTARRERKNENEIYDLRSVIADQRFKFFGDLTTCKPDLPKEGVPKALADASPEATRSGSVSL